MFLTTSCPFVTITADRCQQIALSVDQGEIIAETVKSNGINIIPGLQNRFSQSGAQFIINMYKVPVQSAVDGDRCIFELMNAGYFQFMLVYRNQKQFSAASAKVKCKKVHR